MSNDFQITPTPNTQPAVLWAIRKVADYSDEAFRSDLARASEQRREKLMRKGAQCGNPSDSAKASLLSYMTLWNLLEHAYGITDAPLFDYRSETKDGNGDKTKPALTGYPNIYFSLSHTDNAILAVVANVPVGADIQTFRTPSQKLIHRALSEEEQQALEGLDDQEKAFAFARIWTRKEAFLKMTGKGIQSLHSLKREVPQSAVFEEGTAIEEGYAWSICVGTAHP